jgi:hypothetical protein
MPADLLVDYQIIRIVGCRLLIDAMLDQLPAPIPLSGDHRISAEEITMKLVYDVIEDVYDDTTQIRAMTEQAQMPSRDWLIRTTVYTPHHISVNVTHIPRKKSKKSLFKSVR